MLRYLYEFPGLWCNCQEFSVFITHTQCIQAHTHACTHTYTHTNTYTHILTHVYTHMHTHTPMHSHTNSYSYICVYIKYIYAHKHTAICKASRGIPAASLPYSTYLCVGHQRSVSYPPDVAPHDSCVRVNKPRFSPTPTRVIFMCTNMDRVVSVGRTCIKHSLCLKYVLKPPSYGLAYKLAHHKVGFSLTCARSRWPCYMQYPCCIVWQPIQTSVLVTFKCAFYYAQCISQCVLCVYMCACMCIALFVLA